jgi:hypothetical protein
MAGGAMKNCFTIRYPGSLAPDCDLYPEFWAGSIETFEPATQEELSRISAYQRTGLWKICVNGNKSIIFLDDKSYVMTPDGVKYEYPEFLKLFKILNNMNIERALEAL